VLVGFEVDLEVLELLVVEGVAHIAVEQCLDSETSHLFGAVEVFGVSVSVQIPECQLCWKEQLRVVLEGDVAVSELLGDRFLDVAEGGADDAIDVAVDTAFEPQTLDIEDTRVGVVAEDGTC